MQKLIILGAGWFQQDLVQKAHSLGYETHVFGTGKLPVQTAAAQYADHHYPISVLDRKAILEEAKRIGPVGVVSMGADVVVPTMAFLNQELGLTGNSQKSALMSTNKWLMKLRFLECGVPTARFIFVYEDYEPAELPFRLPVVVKAIDRAGKLGITKVERLEDLSAAIKYGLKWSENSDRVLVEEFVEGREYSVEAMSHRGFHRRLAFTEKFSVLPHFVEEMHLQPAPFSKEQEEQLWDVARRALDALLVENGASHVEFKVTPEGEPRVIEVGARMAAESMWEVVKLSTGLDYMRMVIDSAVGMEPDWTVFSDPDPVGLVKFVITKPDFENLELLRREHPQFVSRIDTIAPYQEDKEITSNPQRYGYYLLRCGSREQALYMARPQSA